MLGAYNLFLYRLTLCSRNPSVPKHVRMRKTKPEKRQPMKEEISEWEVDSIKPVSNQFKTTFYRPAIMECPFCRTTSAF
jgi:hypothetical protein